MATTTTTTVPAPVPFPFTGLPGGTDLDRTPLPRGMIAFESPSTAITQGGANDQLWDLQCLMPEGYAYVLAEVHMRIQGAIADLADWDKGVSGSFGTALRAIPFDGVAIEDAFATSLLDHRTWVFDDLPKTIILNGKGIAGDVRFFVGNHSAGGAAVTGAFYIRCLQYDIEQAHHVLLHTPQLTR